jgi:hypothetical protein
MRLDEARAAAVGADEALLARQAALQAEAETVLADLDLLRVLRTIGRPVRTGSSVLGLMVARDIDVTSLCPSLNPIPIFEAMRSLVPHPRVVRLAFRNDTGRWNVNPDYPDGVYWGVTYRSDANDVWNLDLWFLLEGTTQFDLLHVESLPRRLTREARLAVLRIKEAMHGLPAYGSEVHGYDVYAAVLDHGVTTPDEFQAFLAQREPGSRT